MDRSERLRALDFAHPDGGVIGSVSVFDDRES